MSQDPGRPSVAPTAAAPATLFGPVPQAGRGVLWWLGWLVPVIAAHRVCTPTRPGRVIDPLIERVRFWRTLLALTLTVCVWLTLHLVPPREIPGQLYENFFLGLVILELLFLLALAAVSMAPKGRRRAAASRWRGSFLAFVLVEAALVLFQTTGAQWPPASPLRAACALWLLLFGGSGGLLLLSNGCRTADVNETLPTLVPLLPLLPMTLPLAAVDPAYDRVPLAVRLLAQLTGPVSLVLLARWELRRLRTLHDVRVSHIWNRA
ncbi:hypothetical protein [Streptomyces sp. SID12501]|uniref:Uncharacterized protein n=1 Tax=Streptomyces sp. SID12501 TaxID=2706042 RepID=A0A6B3BY40_9ACTN|nr:hypothetical protein [Streptomyces sp. SID12501]NEC89285.1 hypothetical protein [Streptomyces sp. SID12501]